LATSCCQMSTWALATASFAVADSFIDWPPCGVTQDLLRRSSEPALILTHEIL
jgi:hypothetical protein